MKNIARLLFLTFLIIVVIIFIQYCIDRSNNRHAKIFWGLAETDPKGDTVYIQKHDTTTITKYDPTHSPFIVNKPVVSKHGDLNKPQPTVTQNNENGNNESNTNTGTNSGTIGGQGNASNGAHVVNGTNNGINGDVNSEKQLTEDEEVALLQVIEMRKKADTTDTKVVEIMVAPYSNGNKFAVQVRNFLISQGYSVKTISQFISGEQIKNARVFIAKSVIDGSNPVRYTKFINILIGSF